MLLTGTITRVEPPDFSDKYGNQYQNIYIDAGNGELKGRIGCKKPYTQESIGSQGQWECEQASSPQGQYNKLKKHFDQPYQGQQSTRQRGTDDKPDWDAIAEGKVRHGVVCAAIQSGQVKVENIQDIEYWKNYIITGRAPLPPSKIPEPHPDITERHNPNKDEVPY